MYDFAYKLFNVALPRVRDFRGVSANSFDGRGNYSMGVKEQLIFPEIEYDKVLIGADARRAVPQSRIAAACGELGDIV